MRYQVVSFLVYRLKKNLEIELDKLSKTKQELQHDIRLVTSSVMLSSSFDRYTRMSLCYLIVNHGFQENLVTSALPPPLRPLTAVC